QLEGLRCGDHERVAKRVHAMPGGVPITDEDVRVAIYTPSGELRRVGARRGADFKLGSSGLKQALAEVQDELGPPRVPFEALQEAGGRLLALERGDPERRAGFVEFAELPGVLGDWARFRAREACAQAIARARAEGSLGARLPRLRKDFGDEPGCAQLLDEAAREVE
ncbi:MAG: hypothetical protein KDD82_06750, partial [Planctomycetes bacterium]|nr:hypothetical protein [Planctomycetota bacterium]